jgi:hypothetical protein
MTQTEWNTFSHFRDQFRAQVALWNAAFASVLMPLQQSAAMSATPPYRLETPVVYNTALDDVESSDDIRLIIVADNPGKDEQLAKNRRYLVGQAGKLGNGFFKNNPELGIDFRKNVLILNKTPVHTAKTAQLQYLYKNGGAAVKNLLDESQNWMAEKTAWLHKALFASGCSLWLVGYGELKAHGVFETYREALVYAYGFPELVEPSWESVLVFQHFSMNRFAIDLKQFRQTQTEHNARTEPHVPCALSDSLRALGNMHRKKIFGEAYA